MAQFDGVRQAFNKARITAQEQAVRAGETSLISVAPGVPRMPPKLGDYEFRREAGGWTMYVEGAALARGLKLDTVAAIIRGDTTVELVIASRQGGEGD